MKNQNKILMSLLTASVSELAAAPTLANEAETAQGNKVEGNYIDFKYVVDGSEKLTEEQILVKNDIKAQVEAMLTKKAPIMKIAESIDIIAENYAKNDSVIKQQVFEDLQLGAAGADACADKTSDSSCLIIKNIGDTKSGTTGNPRTKQCHAVCHTACHGACHGSRGWR
jgi:hypothetical protein